MCGGGGSSNEALQRSQAQEQLAAQQRLSDQSLAQQQRIADTQAAANKQQFDYQVSQDDRRLQDTKDQAARQSSYDQSRAETSQRATDSINQAFAKFSPDYFKQYQKDYYAAADDQINQQYGYAKKDLAFGLARGGNLASTTAADQQGRLLETKGRVETDQANAAVNAATSLRQQTDAAKSGLLGQALSTNTLGSPIAAGTVDAVNAAQDTANRAVSTVTAQANDFTSGIKTVQPTLGALAGVFGGAAGAGANYLSGAQDARVASAFGGAAGPGATSLGGGSSTKVY